MMIESEKKAVGDLNSTAYEIEAAEERIARREREREWVSARLDQTERDLCFFYSHVRTPSLN